MTGKQKDRLKKLSLKAKKNWEERTKIMKEVKALINEDEGIWSEMKEVDFKFAKKVNHYPGDITTCRINKVFDKMI